ncbi:MAG: serine/threonine-protein phosphatase [Clostridiales bacterium]|nr:serine/threonine-protein phosphatase [Clostridiales bacterium]
MYIDLSLANLINLVFIGAGIGICCMSIQQVGSGIHIRKEVKGYFQLFFTLISVYISMHLIRMLLEGRPGSVYSVAIRVVTFIEFLVSGFMIYMLTLLILFIASPGKMGRIMNYIFLVFLIVHSIGLIVDQFTNFYYYFDELNVYHRARGYAMSNMMHILMLTQNMFLLVKYRDKFDKRLASSLWIYLLTPMGAIVLQLAFQEIQFIILTTVICAAYLCFVISRIQLERYENQQKEKERLDTELTLATRIQAETLPNIFPAFPDRKDFNIYASMNPAKEVGGDFYDFFLLDDTHLGIVMADVSGKGVPAALFMMVSKILIQNIAMMGNRPAEVLRRVNNQLCSKNKTDMFVTVWYGCLDLETGVLEAANAGHEYPVLKKADGNFELIKDKHGLVIGALEGSKYRSYELMMEPGAKLFIYTDGVPEATNANNELFGTERLVRALRMKESGNPQEIIEHIDSIVKDFVKDAPQFDDLTMLCLEYSGQKRG